jgi:hypothetical protein
MATLLAETQWHDNPRPVLAYAWSSVAPAVTSPYYLDGRTVPAFFHGVTDVVYATAGNAVTQDQDVRQATGSILVSGVVKADDTFSVNWLTWGSLGDAVARGAAGTFTKDMGAEEAATAIAAFINGNIDTRGSTEGPLVIMTPSDGQTEIQVGVSTYVTT